MLLFLLRIRYNPFGFLFSVGLCLLYESPSVFFSLCEKPLTLTKGSLVHLFSLIFNFENLFNAFFIHIFFTQQVMAG